MDSTEFVEKHLFIKHKHDGTPNGGAVIPSDYFANLYVSGYVGIGTTSPAQKLDVVGIIKSSGSTNSLMFEDRTTSTHSWEWYSSSDVAGLYTNITGTTLLSLDTTGNLSISGGITGKTNGTSAASGKIGERISATFSWADVAATTTWKSFASITLSAGVWDIDIHGTFYANSGAISTEQILIGTTQDSSSGYSDGINSAFDYFALSGAQQHTMSVSRLRVNITTSTIYYFNACVVYSSGTPWLTGRISAERVY